MKKVVVSLVTIAVVLSLITIASSAASTCPAQSTSAAKCPATTTAQCTSTTTSASCCPCPITSCPVITPCSAAVCCVQTVTCTPVKSVGGEKAEHTQFAHPEMIIENKLKARSSPTFEGNVGKNIGTGTHVDADVNQANTAVMTQTSGDVTANSDVGQSATGGAASGGTGGTAAVGGDGAATGGDGTANGGSAFNSANTETNALGPEQIMGPLDQTNNANIIVVNNY